MSVGTGLSMSLFPVQKWSYLFTALTQENCLFKNADVRKLFVSSLILMSILDISAGLFSK